jgi:hypothetical protein
MFTNTKIYNYFTNTQSYDLKVDANLGNSTILTNQKELIDYFQIKINGISQTMNNGYGDYPIFYNTRESVESTLKNEVQGNQMSRILNFVIQERLNPYLKYITTNIPETHSAEIKKNKFSSINYEIIVNSGSLFSRKKTEIRISDITYKLFDKPHSAVTDDTMPLYVFNGSLKYNLDDPNFDKFTFTSKFSSGKKPFILFRLIIKIQNLLATIFRI